MRNLDRSWHKEVQEKDIEVLIGGVLIELMENNNSGIVTGDGRDGIEIVTYNDREVGEMGRR